MDTNRRELLGEGRLSLVYRLEDGRMLKVFKHPSVAVYEFRQASAAWRAGVTRQQPYELLQEDGKEAIVYDYLEGRTLMDAMNQDRAHTLDYLKRMADCHAEILRGASDALDRYKDHLAHAIAHAPHLDEAYRSKLLQALPTMPDGDHVLHGDLHPLNIIVSGQQLTAIDWMTASRGDPAADIARTLFIMRYSSQRETHGFVEKARRALTGCLVDAAYLRCVLRKTGVSRANVYRWLPFVAAGRLTEERPPREVRTILKIVERWARTME